MKLGVGYNVFSGVELLEYSIKQIREYTKNIIVAYQMFDWFGKVKIEDEDILLLHRLKEQGLIDELYEFQISKYATNPYEAKALEITKRNILKEKSFHSGCDYFLCMDVDEFYKKDQFLRAINIIESNNYDFTACKIVDYYKYPIFQKPGYNRVDVPFICRNYLNIQQGQANFFTIVDPTRSYNIKNRKEFKQYMFSENELLMHHMRGVRKDIRKKWITTSQSNLDRSEKNIDYIVNSINSIDNINLVMTEDKHSLVNNCKFIVVDNQFSIDYESWNKV